LNSEKLQKHTKFWYTKGSIYLTYNSNLLYHGCVPLNSDSSFKSFKFAGETYKGKSLFDFFEKQAREAFFNSEDIQVKQQGLDFMWYIWCGECSPLFGKKKMATFERYFIEDKNAHIEEKNAYYTLREEEATSNLILEEFGLDPEISHIVTGHVPVKAAKGENPLKANGKMLVIDGGFSKAYHKETGIAGYTLIYNSMGLLLVSHDPFESIEKAINEEKDILPTTVVSKQRKNRILVGDTDVGVELKENIRILNLLLEAYRRGMIL